MSLCNNVTILNIDQWQSSYNNAFTIQMFVLAHTISDNNFRSSAFSRKQLSHDMNPGHDIRHFAVNHVSFYGGNVNWWVAQSHAALTVVV